MHNNRYSLPNSKSSNKADNSVKTDSSVGVPRDSSTFVDLIPLLYSQIESCPGINQLYDSYMIPSYTHVFTPSVIVGLPTHISQVPEILDESLFIMDFLAFISMSHFGDSEYLKNLITKHIAKSRVIADINKSTISTDITGYLFDSVETGLDIIDNNPHLLAIYLVGFVRTSTAYVGNRGG